MHAEILAIGTELTTGAKLDTNSQWLSLELSAVGIPVKYHTTVADDLDANVAVLRTAVERADIVIITGGLGPTLDDLTREAIAQLLNVKLELHEPSLEIIRGMFSRRGRPMPDRNVVQAMFPAGSVPIANPRGTAPGIYVEITRAGKTACKVAAMPGVPSEMKPMFRDDVLARIVCPETAGRVMRIARINCFGLGESAFEELLGDVTARNRDPEVGITVHDATITLRIVAEAASIAECEQKIAATRAVIHDRLGKYVFGVEDEELQHPVVRLLKDRSQTVATAEIGTSGLVAYRLSEIDGFESIFQGGTILPASHVTDVAQTHDLSLTTTVDNLALRCRDQSVADFALAVGPMPRVEPGNASAPIVRIALASVDGVQGHDINLVGDPAIQRSRLAKSALNLLRLQLLK